MNVVITAIALLVLFVAITMGELWVMKYLGYDIIARFRVKLTDGKAKSVFFEAFGIVAFIMVQPIVLAWLFARISTDLQRILLDVASRATAFIS